ncbi:hypothetical protein SNE25_18730 [Mucilaginibacter sabulilitoris]|uniref:PKD/Chitinase domain-containing protein n=1 Tax=Mucilaginibacter sabulilitoris TaxID=1173583 RepID=A0ABZ0TG12_9SPHI|nr:hypothetical protein [Mucilaginibacter sabulilitoris]WPU91357.1 hypothetical protein SNE25_18730 [Mucilaginibacter sabulilitoris]
MANPVEYIVFEPDQVLTNDHLNETFNYLDQQNRWTRNKLIGIGIVCGLEITLRPGIIGVTKGCGVTSQGYLITQNSTQYTYYLPYNAIDVPADLPFVYDKGALPFYKPFCTGKEVWMLLSDEQFKTLESADKLKAKTLSTPGIKLSDYVVVLFLEARETDLKNCDTQDCNNKGEKMEFQVRPLLVKKTDLPGNAIVPATRGDVVLPKLQTNLVYQIPLKRFNVPYTDLNTTDNIIDAFLKLADDATLTLVSNAYNDTYTKYSTILKVSSNPFANLLNDLKKYRDLLLKQNPIFIEYFYDFIDDLIKAYYEFSSKISGVISTCCPDENLFPLHLVLGDASLASNAYVKDSDRNYFIYSPLFAKMGTESAEVILLFNRMMILIKNFMAQNKDILSQSTIKITPSQYEFPWLSERAIPYYYKINTVGAELYKAWSYYKTSRGNAVFNLSYNAGLYNSNTLVTQPLLYDIESYNFFRVEGHIGQNYQTVLTNILNQRLNFNLPFDVVAVSAEQLSGDATLPDCNIRDLETEYNLIVSEAMCKIHTTFCFVTKLPYTPAKTPPAPGVLTNVTNVTNVEAVKFSDFKLRAALTPELAIVANTAYKKGDFLRTYCPAVPNTIGSGYLSSLSNTGVFTNPVNIDQADPLTAIYYYFFQFVNTVEELMFALNTNNISNIDMDDFGVKYQNYLRDTTLATNALILLTVKNTAPKDTTTVSFIEDYQIDLLVEAFGVLTSICIDERFQVLKKEYTDRLTQYKQQLAFLNYYKNHPGLEHKAGVPKGGTLVLVYKNVPPTRTVPGRTFTDAAGAVFTNAANTPIARAADTKITGEQPATRAAASAVNTRAAIALDENTLNRFKKILTDSKEVTAAERQSLLDVLAGQATVTSKYPVINGAVIADFYIPYLCCSDCPPVAYIMPEKETPPPVQEKPVIKMQATFCDNDANPTKIGVSVPGGTFNAVAGIDAVNQTFTPATAGKGKFSIIYTVNGVSSDPFEVTVLPTPGSEFSFVSTINADLLIQATFTPTVQDATFTYKWQFDDAWKVDDIAKEGIAKIEFRFNRDGGEKEYKVALQVSNGNCNDPNGVVKILHASANGLFEPNVDPTKSTGKIENLISRKKKE